MANDFDHDRPDAASAPMTREEARAALGDLEHDGATLAARIVTPRWYHPALGVITAVFTVAQALPGLWPVAASAIGIAAVLVLTTTYKRRYGVAVSQPVGPRTRRLLRVVLAVLIAAMMSGLAIKLLGLELWWVLIPAAISFATTVVVGRRYDEALREEIAAQSGARP
jgi:hypothetical protein